MKPGILRGRWGAALLLGLGLWWHAPLAAQCVRGGEYRQSEAVQKHYADPAVRIDTPAFAPGTTGFTSHDEMMHFLRLLEGRADNLRLHVYGQSQEGRAIPTLVLSDSRYASPEDLRSLGRPVVMLVGQVHGNEPAGSEAMLALAQSLATGELRPLLDRITVVIVPRANPDGAHHDWRATASCLDINRDHLKVELPETRVLRHTMNLFRPHVFADAHEFSVATRWVEKFGLIQSYDFVMLYATNPNVPPALTQLARDVFRVNLVRDVERAGYTHFWYYTTSYNMKDKRVSMGGTAPDIGRNFAGLQNALSFLIETRGVGIGRENYARRVHTHYVVMSSLLRTTAEQADQVLRVVQAARDEVVQRGRQPSLDDRISVTSRPRKSKQTLTMMNPNTAELAAVEVDWNDTLAAETVLSRRRPFAYLMPPSFGEVAQRLALSGVEVQRLRRPVELEVESYDVVARGTGKAFVEGHIRSTVKTEVLTRRRTFPAGSYVFAMGQPNANVIAVALEPEAPSSFVSLGVIPTDKRGVATPTGGGAPSEVPVYRLMERVPLDAAPLAP